MAGPGDELNRFGMGSLTFWGSTPAYDLTEIMSKEQQESSNPTNILLLGQNDARHILKTLSNLKNSDKELNVYIVENHPILQARQLLLLHLAFLPLDKLGLHEKTTEFMEIFGNVLVRPQTKKTIRKACETLIRLVTDDSAMAVSMPLVSLQDLKFRDRDAIADCMKDWANSERLVAEVQEMWNHRIQQHLGSRYDARVGVFDWDYHMRVVDKNKDAKIVHISEFKTWRNSGQAFNEYESDYNQVNPTYFHVKDQPYQGDILVGPFIPYGIKSDEESLFKKTNDSYKKKSSEVTFHNLEKIFSIISPKTEAEGLSKKFNNFKIHFLPLDACEKLWKRSIFQEKFHTVLVSSFMGHKIKPEIVKLLKMDATVVVDRAKYVWYFRPENEKAYEKKVLELAKTAGLKLRPLAGDNKIDKNENVTDFIKFEIRKPNQEEDNESEVLSECKKEDDTKDTKKNIRLNEAGDF